MVTSKLLVRKNKTTGKAISQQLLFDDDTTEHIIISGLPNIEERQGYIGEYVVKEDGTVEVVYTEKPKTEVELLQEKQLQQEQLIADLMLMVAQGGVTNA